MVVGLAPIGFFGNVVVTLCTLGGPGAHLPAKGSPSNCSESGSEQWMFGVNELGILLGNCSAMDAEGGVGCRVKGT